MLKTPSLRYPIQGDKVNSTFFQAYLPRLLEERDRIGLTEMIRGIDALMIMVEPGHALAYLGELCLMTPYHYLVTLESERHLTHVLRIDHNAPDILIREAKHPEIRGIFRSLNEAYPIGMHKPNSRYMGEILRVSNLKEVIQLQKNREIRFFNPDQIQQLELPNNLAMVKPSPYTNNVIAYWEQPDAEKVYQLGESSIRYDVNTIYYHAKEIQATLEIDTLILPIDHLATRVYSQNREFAILEYLTLSSYYYWGSYDIVNQNSSTNVTKSVHYSNELVCPAKVFTAANHPYFLTHLVGISSPTEQFVRNFGPRLHHLAVAVADGEQKGKANIDYVVERLREYGRDFLLDVIGSKEEGLKQIFSSASEHSHLIIEYVQRFGDFQGFFAKDNVAELTRAAGIDESLKKLEQEINPH